VKTGQTNVSVVQVNYAFGNRLRDHPLGDAADCARAIVGVASRDPLFERDRVRRQFERELGCSAVGTRAMSMHRQVVARRFHRRPDR
jgi:hypothetical protein